VLRSSAPQEVKLICIRVYAGKISNALESVGLLNDNSPEKSQRHGINQQGIDKFNPLFIKWFIGFSEGDGSFVINGGKSIFSRGGAPWFTCTL